LQATLQNLESGCAIQLPVTKGEIFPSPSSDWLWDFCCVAFQNLV